MRRINWKVREDAVGEEERRMAEMVKGEESRTRDTSGAKPQNKL